MPFLSQTIANLVAADGLPRVALDERDEVGTPHVLYLEPGALLPTSMRGTDWLAQRGPLPNDPTPQEVAAALAQRAADRQQVAQDAAALRQQIQTLAQSTVGVRVDLLTAGQVRALQAILLWQAGALDRTGVVRPLAEWVRG